MRSICPYTAFTASHWHDHRVSLSDFSVSFRSSPCTSVSLNRACRLGLDSKEVVQSLDSPQSVTSQWFNLCHSILKGEVEHMSVTRDLDTERGVLFHSCLESLVYTVDITRPIECLTNNVLEVKIEFSDSRFHQFIQYFALG